MDDETLEHYDDNNIVDTYVVNPLIRNFISDITFKNLVLPDSLKILDLWGDDHDTISLNIPSSIELIILKNLNLINVYFLNIFVGKYIFVNVRVNNTDLNILVNQLYMKYFNKQPKCEQMNKYLNNTIISKYHHNIIQDILEYEQRITQGCAFSKLIKEELVALAFHPDRIGPLIKKYGLEIIESL